MEIDSVISQLVNFGLEVKSVKIDGKIYRVRHQDDKKGKKNGWYVIYEVATTNGSVFTGSYGSWKEGQTHKIKVDAQGLSAQELANVKARQAQLKKQADAERKKKQQEAAVKAKRIFSQLGTQGKSDYLVRKKVKGFGVKFSKGSIVIPMQKNGVGVGLQFVSSDGTKYFLTGQDNKGAYHFIGSDTTVIAVGEGYSTCASVHMATNWSVAVAFNASNLEAVAKSMRVQFPQSQIIIVGDDDRFLPLKNPPQPNVGRVKGDKAAFSVDSVVVFPKFSAASKGVDWNDLHCEASINEVKTQLLAGVKLTKPKHKSLIFSQKILVENFVVIHGDNLIWDGVFGRLIKLQSLKLSAGEPLVNSWMSHPMRRIIDKDNVVFEPSMIETEDKINLFTGLEATPVAGDCSLMLGLLMKLCGDDHALYDWILKWVAYPLQNIGAKMKTSIVMYGEEGTGKNLWWESVAEIYGKYSVVITQSEIESDFNGWASTRLFIIADEVVSRAEMRHMKGRLKGLVTGDRIMINEKGLPQRQESNHMNIVFLSNEDQPLQLDMGDRRYTVAKSDEVKESQFYAEIGAQRDNGGVEALFAHLMNLNLGSFNEHTKPFSNANKKDLIEVSKPSPQRFLKHWQGQYIPLNYSACESSDLYSAYVRWCKTNGERMPWSMQRFGRIMAKSLQRKRLQIAWKGSQFEVKSTIYVPSDQINADIKGDAIKFRSALSIWVEQIKERGL